MTDEDLTLPEVGRAVLRIEKRMDEFIGEMRAEMRETRHKAANAMAGVELLKTIQMHTEEHLERLDKSDDRQWEDINHLKENSASQLAVDSYRKWLIGLVLTLGPLGVINLLISLNQGGSP